MPKTIQFVVSGRVQGVGFRYATRGQALSLGLTGWVRNNKDGDVEGIVQGEKDELDGFKKWLWLGPPSAIVSKVEANYSDSKILEDFQIVR